MSRILCCLTLALSLVSEFAEADASAGIFAILDEVVLEPSHLDPDRVRLRGIFVIPQPRSSGLHRPPERGELYFSLNPDNPDASRADWQALHAASGTGDVVAFAEYWTPTSLDQLPGQIPIQKFANVSSNTSLVVTVHTAESPVLPEPYPIPNRAGVLTRFNSEEQLCPRFGASSSEIVAGLWEAYDPGRAHPELPVCSARIGLIDSGNLDTSFFEQTRDADWAGATEAMLHRRIADASVEVLQLTVECRYTICYLGFIYPSLQYQIDVGNRLTADLLDDLSEFARGAKIRPASGAAATREFWIQRRDPASASGPETDAE